MTLHVSREDYNEEFFARQCKMLQPDSKASRSARLHLTPHACHRYWMDFGVHDLDLADPFEWTDPFKFWALS
jgi:hypothetical protein